MSVAASLSRCFGVLLCRRLAASLLGLGGPGSGVAALRSLGLVDSMEVSVAFSSCSTELRVILVIPGGALKHSVIELAGQIFFASLQYVKRMHLHRLALAVAVFRVQGLGFRFYGLGVEGMACFDSWVRLPPQQQTSTRAGFRI